MVLPQNSSLVECLHMVEHPDAGVVGVIALDSTVLGPAAGGCRIWDYPSPEARTTDAIRLARGMSYKNALAGLPFGGGKAVLQSPANPAARRELLAIFADAVASLDGAYVTAEDVGTSVADMQVVAMRTRHVAGLNPQPGKAGGDPSPWTALGIYKSMQAASQVALGTDLRGLTVAVQGVGNVGSNLCALLSDAGARLIVADLDPERAAVVAMRFGGKRVSIDEVMAADADILAPCALGSVLNPQTIPALKVKLVCGGANNQLANDADGDALRALGIAYAPDYAVNAGGIISVAAEYLGDTVIDVERRIDLIAERVALILQRASCEGRSSHVVADEMARSLIALGRRAAA